MPTRRTLTVPALLCGLALGAASCALSNDVTWEDVDKAIESKYTPLYEARGIGPATALCVRPLKGEVGAHLDCPVKDGRGRMHRVRVTVTSVDGWDVRFAMKEV